MRIVRLAGVLVAIITVVGGYLSFKYGTTSTCEAAQIAIRDEMPKIVEELAERDNRFRALRVGQALFGSSSALLTGALSELAAEEVADKTAVECGILVLHREVDRAGFRRSVGDDMADRLANALN